MKEKIVQSASKATKLLYFDNCATTLISKQALEVYNKASKNFYNPSALYEVAGKVKDEIEQTRKNILAKFKAPVGSTIVFTGSATEANNAVLNSCITRKDKKYLISAGEHSSVYECAKELIMQGYNIEFIPLKANGCVDEELLFNKLDKSVAFVSIIHVSNETGAINDISNIVKKIKSVCPACVVHSDGVQAVGKLEINLTNMGVDYYTISAHKINGPKGVGALFIKQPNKFKPFIYGGGQEKGLRSGTENIPAILSFGKAVEEVKIKDFFKHKIALINEIKEEHILVSKENCVSNIVSICFAGVRGETIVHMLEEQGFLIGTGSACNSKAKTNRVLAGIVDRKFIEGAVRISFDNNISINDCKNLGVALNYAVAEYKRKMKWKR